MKILLCSVNTAGSNEIPINLPLLQAVLKRAGHDVRLLDLTYYLQEDFKDEQVRFGFFKPAPAPPVSRPIARRYTDLAGDLAALLAEFKPGLVGISTLSVAYGIACDVARYCKLAQPGVPVALGGIHAIIASEEAIARDEFDFVCYGEAETVLPELCRCIEKGDSFENVRNFYLKHNGNVVRTEPAPLTDLNKLPPLDLSGYSDYDMYRPLDGKLYKMLNCELSRGCTFQCSYCINHFLQRKYRGLGRYHRVKHVDRAIGELAELVARHDFNCVRFWDEDFTLHSRAYLNEFLTAYRKQIDLPFLVYARVETIDREKLALLKEAGCITLAVGIESGNPWLRRHVLNRRTSNDEIVSKFHLCHEAGIRVSAYNMIGLPFETREMIFDTIRLNRACAPDAASVTFFEPYPNTDIFDLATKFGFLTAYRLPTFTYKRPHINSPYITEADLAGLMRTFLFYIRCPESEWSRLVECEKDATTAERILPKLLEEMHRHE